MSAAPITEAIQANTAQEVGHKVSSQLLRSSSHTAPTLSASSRPQANAESVIPFRQVFAGNLSFQTKDADLEQAFAVHGKVTEAQVIMRGQRSRGYGFVTFASEAEATAAVAALDKSDLQGRQINVELAKPPTESTAGRAIREAAQKATDKGLGEGEDAGEAQEGETKPKKRNARSKKGARRPRTDAETEEAGDAPLEGATGENGELVAGTTHDAAASGERKRASRARKSKKKTTTTDGEATPATNEDGAANEGDSTRPARTPRRRGPPEGNPSKTLLFFSNLSFSTTDESLKEALKDYDVVSAVVIKRPYGPTAGRSKGFAFVDFKDEKSQQRALEEVQGRDIEGRNVSVKVAIQEEKKEEAAQAMPTEEGAAPAQEQEA
ncbi:BZ3500_MvSof-1268-A1-R1_Chr2-1g04268 [Microbotryum saponariae]|uniref:BZ3500_MvSof-1268-A1-R1_Chr2-1g04268 protein n=1 Tax=Microbotryum saponariae TaxID=289078 RepID=A0A2X0KYI6_9BASI|nr:BZ3500_MvSof-1268-A1-R1_Chr2-1g04268 [Microbotryum saponariae]SCZ91273.1 BZ3501_MvSof-1269-A2-R1_Chr2-1g03924 [Microbotryum saponariae]